MNTSDRTRKIAIAGWVGIFANAVLSFFKITIGFVSGSFAVVSDGVDSATDVLTSAVIVFTIGYSSKPPDKEHPFGHARAEAVATKVLSFIIFFAGAQLAYLSVKKLIFEENLEVPSIGAVYVTLASILVKFALALYKFKVGKKTSSQMLIADAKNMKNDVLISFSVLAGLFATYVLKLPLLDPLLAMIISILIMKEALGIFWGATEEVMDGNKDKQAYRDVFLAVNTVENAFNPHKARIRKIGSYLVIDLDVEVPGNVSVDQGHEVAKEVEKAIKNKIDNVYDVQVHIEPEGNSEKHECFGLNEKNLED